MSLFSTRESLPNVPASRHWPAGDRSPEWPDWPAFGLVNDLLPTLESWAREKRRFALATLISIRGSAPRPVGSEMAIAEDGDLVGYVSGGCVEAAVAEQALAVLAGGLPRILDYGLGSPVIDVRLACGGRIRIQVRDVADPAMYVSRLRAARAARVPLTVAIDLASGKSEFRPDGDTGEHGGEFLLRKPPPLRLLIVGGDPVTLALASLAPAFDFEVSLIRPNGPADPPPGIAIARYERGAADAALSKLGVDPWTAIYTATHDEEVDQPILMAALRSPAFCVGALGSRRRIAARKAHLREAGMSETEIERLNVPAGISIGASTPQQIALSILGQIIAQRPR